MKSPQRLSSRLTVSFVALFFATLAVIVGLTLYFANRAFQTSTDNQIQGVADTADERLKESGDWNVIDQLSTAGQYLQLLDAQGNIIHKSSNIGRTQQLPTFLRGDQPVVSDGFHTIRFRNTEVRLVRHALRDDTDNVTGYVLVAGVVPNVDESLRNLAIILVATGALGLLSATVGTVWVARREARPLQELADAVSRTAASGFEEAIPAQSGGSREARELREAFSELVDRQRELISRERVFFADSSHVLRTPLAVLQGDVEMLEQGIAGKERQEVVAQARTAIDAMSRTVSGLLLLSRQQDGASSSWEVINLADLLEGLVDDARTAYPGLSVALQQTAAPLEVAGDQHQLRDLFTSLLENSCRYTPAGGAVVVSLAQEARDAVVEVRDTGIGLTAEEAARALDRFYRGARARRMFPGGSGLGLAIASRIAVVHNGELTLGANNGQGAVARVKLPLLD